MRLVGCERMRGMFWFLLSVIYVAGFVLTYGGTLAFFQKSWPNLAQKDYRNDVAFAVFVALTPIGWLVELFMCGFYKHGFMWRRTQ
jgi:hypothetical protein